MVETKFQRFWWLPAAVGFAAILWVLPFWPAFVSPNEWPRVYQALAVVHRGSLAVNEEVAQWGVCEDLSLAEGKLYPNKAPGFLPLMLPALAWSLAFVPSETKVFPALVLITAAATRLSAKSWVAPRSYRQKVEHPVVHDLCGKTPGESWLVRLQREARSDQEQRLLYRFLHQPPPPGKE